MSVFNDFQRLWMQRFPQSSLSDAWESDVRASLDRHKQKIEELTKELEQETLYVEYLESLLNDVEKYRESGGDPTLLFEAATTTAAAQLQQQQQQQQQQHELDSDDAVENETNKSSLNLRESSGSNNENKDKNNRLSLNTDNKFAANNSSPISGNIGVGNNNNNNNNNVHHHNTTTTTAATATTSGNNSNSNSNSNSKSNTKNNNANSTTTTTTSIGVGNSVTTTGIGNDGGGGSVDEQKQSFDKDEDKDVGTEKDVRYNQKNGALQQCITELAASINNSSGGAMGTIDENSSVVGKSGKSQIQKSSSTSLSSSSSSNNSNKTSHFVTVIEVKESKDLSEMEGGDVEETAASNRFSSFESGNKLSSGKTEPSAPPLSPALTSPSSSSSTSMTTSAYAAHLEARKKVPPSRPPPKNIRRVEPPTIPSNSTGLLSSSPKRDAPIFTGSAMPLPSSTGSLSSSDSPGNSLERNIKPSDILRMKNADSSSSAEIKQFASNRKTTPELSKFANTPELVEEFGRKVGKSESLEKTKRSDASITQSPTGSLGRTVSSPNRSLTPGRNNVGASPTSSLSSKTAKLATVDSSSTGSLEKKSRSSLQQAIGGDADAATARNAGSKESLASQGISEIIKSYESVSDNEPYYDTVPLDNGDGEYVYIKPGRTGSSSSRDDLSTACSTLPMRAVQHLSSQASVTDPESPGRTINYANIDYFLHQSNETRSSSMDSENEDEVLPNIMRAISHDEQTSQTPGALRKNLVSAILESGNARGSKIRSILNSIIKSETIYVECLNIMLQYKKAIHANLGTSQPAIKKEDEKTIFFKIDELYEVHTAFLTDLKKIVSVDGGDVLIGDTFKRLAEMFNLYSAFLHNYGQAIETVKKCSANNPKFKEIVSMIVLKLQTEQSLSLEDLLHKPVARVQINALVFNDLLSETPANHPDHQPLRQAQKTIHMFLKQFNVVNQRLPTESNKNLRRMVKNSFIVELVDGHRKLRHLFLFNDVIACAKYKASGRDRIEYELKWFIPLKDVEVYQEADVTADLKESSPANILQLKTQACTVRDQLLAEERDEKAKKANGMRSGDKYRRKLADLESQLVLASPNLVFRIGNKATNKLITFFLSSDFERTQWIDSILSLQQTCNIPGVNPINALEIHAFIVAMQKGNRTEMGSYLMQITNDESLLVGDLHMNIQGLTGLEQPADLYICIEVDSYGHYFRKATTKMVCRSNCPIWNESFVLELESSQNVRILLYEAQERPKLRAKYILKLNRNWLQETPTSRPLKLNDTLTLNTTFRFVPGEVTLRRVPTAKPGALFGAKMSQVLKREKRDIPFIISACIREVERRGMSEVGIYRVSGSASDLAKLKKSFETNAYEAEQLLKDVDIHSVTGILKSYLRELPEALFSDALYPKFFDTFSAFSNNNEEARITELLKVFEELPQANKASINHILDHLIRVHHQEGDNKMSLHNLAMVFGPTLLRPGQTQTKQKDLLASSTVDVMAQAGILYCFLQARIKKD